MEDILKAQIVLALKTTMDKTKNALVEEKMPLDIAED